MDRLEKAITEVDVELAAATAHGRTVFTVDEVADRLLDLRNRLRMIHDIDDLELRLYAARGV